jgi:multiple sugar transport system ATP-binding protein
VHHVELKNITKRYGNFQATTTLSLTVERGEFCALLGPSDCGKSTLLRMIAGLEEVTEGQILINGSDVTDTPPAKRGIAMVFQSYALYPHLTVRQNIGFSLSVAHAAKKDIEKRTHEVANMLQLDQLLERRPAQLSGGQRQRVAIGRALVREPEVFLFDEPLSNLDTLLRVQMRLELAKLHKRLKATMIYVTHDQVEAMTLADKIVVLDNGQISQIGSPLELYNTPANRFVASFIGTPAMNFLAVKTVQVSGRRVEIKVVGGPTIEIQTRSEGARNQAIDACEIGVRPEHVNLRAPNKSKDDLLGKIDIIEQLGNSTIFHIDTPAGPVVAESRGSNRMVSGDKVGINFERANIHLFNSNGLAF